MANLLFRILTLPRAWLVAGVALLILAGAGALLVGLKNAGLDLTKHGLRLDVQLILEPLRRVKARVFKKPQAQGYDPWSYSGSGNPGQAKPALISGPASSSGRKPYLVRIVIIGQGRNIHLERRTSQLDFIEKYYGKNYRVTQGHLYAKVPGFIERQVMRLQGIKTKYLILFWANQAEPVEIPRGSVNPQVLARVRTSRILGRALREMFKVGVLENKGLLFIVIAFLAVGVIVARMMGYL